MRIFSIVSSLMLILSIGTDVYAESDKQSLVAAYLDLSRTKQTIDATVEAYVDQVVASDPNANREQIHRVLHSVIGWDVMKEPIAEIIMKHFSPEELEEINTFYRSQTGRVYAEKSPAIAIEMSNLMGASIQNAIGQPPN